MKSRNLVIVESPTKAKTINRYLGDGFEVMASGGHVKDLPKSRFGVVIENDFEAEYSPIKGKAKVLKDLQEAARRSDSVYLAPDPDREGEAIAWHIAEELPVPEDKIYRVTFNEITASAVKEAFAHPGKLDRNKVESQQARRILDRIVGYRLSPILWRKVKKGLSAGRVQSVALRLVCEREEEIGKFVKREYWTITARLVKDEHPPFPARLEKIGGEKADIPDEKEAARVTAELKELPFAVEKVATVNKNKKPGAPFTTSQLQQEAYRRFRFTAKKTMTLAQKLYEGIELPGEGHVALTTYIRTDSTRVSNEAQEEALAFIQQEYGPEYRPGTPNKYTAGKKGRVQDAHECIRPISVNRRPMKISKLLDRDLARLYELIWSRFVASQMNPARYREVTADITAGRHLFKAKGSELLFDGHLRVLKEIQPRENDTNGRDNEDQTILPPLEKDDALDLAGLEPKQNFTTPPPRYTEASLIKVLEEKGIGRPSTYAAIMGTLQVRDYTKKEKGRFFPTELGIMVNSLLVEHFPEVLNVQFTALLEDQLDLIEEGRRGWVETLKEFYDRFKEDLDQALQEMEEVEETDITCDSCGQPMVIRWGKKGHFLSCSGFPECKNAKNFRKTEDGKVEVVEEETTGIECDKCGKPMIIRQGRKGPFLACSGFPECKNAKNFRKTEDGKVEVVEEETTGIECDKCGKPMIIRQGRKGPFLACSGFPECKNAKNFRKTEDGKVEVVEEETTGIECDKCGKPMIIRQGRKGPFLACSGFPECKNAKNFRKTEDGKVEVVEEETTGIECDKCGKPMIIRRGKRGPFLACSGFPECRNTRSLAKGK